MKSKWPPNLLSKDGDVRYFADFFSKKEADNLYRDLLTNIQWRHEPIILFGKRIMQPRLTAWYGDPESVYGYSGIRLKPIQWTQALLNIKSRVEQFADIRLTGALLNQYRNGQDSMGWHRDNEKELGPNPNIASVSFGATRKFHLRHCLEKDLKCALELQHGSLLLMTGATQHNWEHALPKTKRELGIRINITFRHIARAER